MTETKILRQIRALVVTAAFLSVVMPSPITYFTWWKEKPENREVYVIWAATMVISSIILYKVVRDLNGEGEKIRKEVASI